VRVADARGRRGLNHARNVGARAARGDFLAFCDADDVVAPGWLNALVDAAGSADIVAGAAELDTLNGAHTIPSRTGEPPGGLRLQLDFLHSVPGGNCGMWTSVARAVGWDESFAYASSDIEFSWRAVLASYRLSVAPKALLRMRQREGIVALARQWYVFGKSDAQLFRRFRIVGMPRSSVTGALREIAWLAGHLADVARPAARRRRWTTLAARRAGRLAGSIRYRVFFP
jgi:glycosyltransferase involved in cell wall biosynthesis